MLLLFCHSCLPSGWLTSPKGSSNHICSSSSPLPQGIPDSVQPFHGTVQQRYRMIGNCVPVPLAAALGRELKRALQQHAARAALQACGKR